ncbi:hypothetical protein HDU67_000652, partial [Dinochytrium kinnereticum]
ICAWDISPTKGTLLYRLSESNALQLIAGVPCASTQVITDFNMEPSLAGPHLVATVEDTTGEVYLVQWDFRSFSVGYQGGCGGGKRRGWGRKRGIEKRRLDDEGGPLVFDYANFFLCYER